MTTDNIGPGKAFLWGLVFKRIPEASTDATASDLTEKVATTKPPLSNLSSSTETIPPTSPRDTTEKEDESGLDLSSSPISEKSVEGEGETDKELEVKKNTKSVLVAANTRGIAIGILLTLLTGGLYGIIALAFRIIHYLITKNEGKPTDKENIEPESVFFDKDQIDGGEDETKEIGLDSDLNKDNENLIKGKKSKASDGKTPPNPKRKMKSQAPKEAVTIEKGKEEREVNEINLNYEEKVSGS
jgi:hypothetical protein